MKLLFVSLGCDKNLVDTEVMLGMLEAAKIEITDDENEADIIVVNTCCFINDAKEESVNTILEMANLKTTGKCKALLVTGCLAQRYQKEIEEEIPEVDAVLGTNSYDDILNAINWEIEVLNGTMDLLNEDKERIDKEHVNSCIVNLGNAIAEKEDAKIAEAFEKLLPELEQVQKSAEEVAA